MDFSHDAIGLALQQRMRDFLHEKVLPAEPLLKAQLADVADPLRHEPPVKEALQASARERGLWNLFLPEHHGGAGLTNLQYAPLAEIMGWSVDLAPEATNCSAPDTGNIELLAEFGTPAQKERWLQPLLEGTIRSCFAMTEPGVASSDASNIETSIRLEGDEYVLNGRKWWSSGALRPKCELLVVMGVSDPEADRYRRQSMCLVPRDTPGVTVLRSTRVFGYDHASFGGHAEIVFDDVRVPAESLLGAPGAGFAIAQARLGPGRIHHCMRLLGQAERGLELLCDRVRDRVAFGRPLAEQGVVQDWIAQSRIDIEQARLLVLKTAWLMDTVGNKGARTEISAIKVAVPAVASRVLDRAMQAFGGSGVSDDQPLASMWTDARYLQIGDGPDEVHKMSLARRELARHSA